MNERKNPKWTKSKEQLFGNLQKLKAADSGNPSFRNMSIFGTFSTFAGQPSKPLTGHSFPYLASKTFPSKSPPPVLKVTAFGDLKVKPPQLGPIIKENQALSWNSWSETVPTETRQMCLNSSHCPLALLMSLPPLACFKLRVKNRDMLHFSCNTIIVHWRQTAAHHLWPFIFHSVLTCQSGHSYDITAEFSNQQSVPKALTPVPKINISENKRGQSPWRNPASLSRLFNIAVELQLNQQAPYLPEERGNMESHLAACNRPPALSGDME